MVVFLFLGFRFLTVNCFWVEGSGSGWRMAKNIVRGLNRIGHLGQRYIRDQIHCWPLGKWPFLMYIKSWYSIYTMVVEYKTTSRKHKYTCDACEYNTNVKNSYTRHLQSVMHLKSTENVINESHKYACVSCVYSTDSNDSYMAHCRSKRHIKLATKPTEWPCSKCNRFLHSSKAKTYHEQTCTQEPPQPSPTQTELMHGMLNAMNTIMTTTQPTSPTICLPISEPSRTDPFGMENALLKSRMKDMDDSLTRYRDMNDRLSKTIKTMQEWTADGGLKCNICETMNTGLEVYEDQYGKQMICNKCCTRMTGFASIRIEKIMVEFLQVHYEVPMSVVDKRIKGEACLAYRPDVMYIDHTRAVHVECDENQHYSYTCDEKRMTDLYAEYPGKTAIWIRWNPHDYKAGNKTQGERLRQLVDTLKQVESMEFDSKIHVIYMFYDEDHPSIVQNISRSFRS